MQSITLEQTPAQAESGAVSVESISQATAGLAPKEGEEMNK